MAASAKGVFAAASLAGLIALGCAGHQKDAELRWGRAFDDCPGESQVRVTLKKVMGGPSLYFYDLSRGAEKITGMIYDGDGCRGEGVAALFQLEQFLRSQNASASLLNAILNYENRERRDPEVGEIRSFLENMNLLMQLKDFDKETVEEFRRSANSRDGCNPIAVLEMFSHVPEEYKLNPLQMLNALLKAPDFSTDALYALRDISKGSTKEQFIALEGMCHSKNFRAESIILLKELWNKSQEGAFASIPAISTIMGQDGLPNDFLGKIKPAELSSLFPEQLGDLAYLLTHRGKEGWVMETVNDIISNGGAGRWEALSSFAQIHRDYFMIYETLGSKERGYLIENIQQISKYGKSPENYAALYNFLPQFLWVNSRSAHPHRREHREELLENLQFLVGPYWEDSRGPMEALATLLQNPRFTHQQFELVASAPFRWGIWRKDLFLLSLDSLLQNKGLEDKEIGKELLYLLAERFNRLSSRPQEASEGAALLLIWSLRNPEFRPSMLTEEFVDGLYDLSCLFAFGRGLPRDIFSSSEGELRVAEKIWLGGEALSTFMEMARNPREYQYEVFRYLSSLAENPNFRELRKAGLMELVAMLREIDKAKAEKSSRYRGGYEYEKGDCTSSYFSGYPAGHFETSCAPPRPTYWNPHKTNVNAPYMAAEAAISKILKNPRLTKKELMRIPEAIRGSSLWPHEVIEAMEKELEAGKRK